MNEKRQMKLANDTISEKKASLMTHIFFAIIAGILLVLFFTYEGSSHENVSKGDETVKSLGESGFYTLNADDSLAKWWSSDDRVRLNTAKMVVNKMKSNNLLNSHGSSVNTIAYEMTDCVNFATEGLYEIFQSETIGSAMLLCAIELGYM
ncbi:hypothetical protein BOO36_19365 [Vibrio navarrensis]|uniref:hypothetical protein n=1 Tax=Vibrio navarrensis TaxID=29495 RepID=UPI001869B256|nr:hypothetical protein [Vibrio navarrensis]EJL6397072.1 hypothetical protein [Vibrio navarrensis]MBE4575947.1 hypothetical protein [Vibrio navarrensis]